MLDRGSSIFNFLRHLHSDFHSDRAKPQSHCRCTRVPRAPRRPRRLPSADFLMTAVLTPVRRCLLWLALHSKPNPFASLLAIRLSSWEKCLFKSSARFSNWILRGVLVLSCVRSFYSLAINPILEVSLGNTLSHSVGCLSFLLTVSA